MKRLRVVKDIIIVVSLCWILLDIASYSTEWDETDGTRRSMRLQENGVYDGDTSEISGLLRKAEKAEKAGRMAEAARLVNRILAHPRYDGKSAAEILHRLGNLY